MCRDQKRARQAETNPTAGVRERRTENPRRKRATKIRTVTAKVCNVPESRGNACAGTSQIIALLLPCFLLPVPGGNLTKLDAGSSKSVSGVPCRGVISNYRGARKCGVGAKSGPKGASCSRRARQGKLQRDDYRHLTRPSTCTIFPRRTAASELEDDPSSAGPPPAA